MAINSTGTSARGRMQREFAIVASTTAGDETVEVVAAPGAGFRIVVMSVHLNVGAVASLTLRSDTTALHGPWAGTATVRDMIWVGDGFGLMACDENKDLDLNISAAATVGGIVSYVVEAVP